MTLFFILGLLAGICIVSVFLAGKIMAYRKELLLAKKSLRRLEKYNAHLQHSIYENGVKGAQTLEFTPSA